MKHKNGKALLSIAMAATLLTGMCFTSCIGLTPQESTQESNSLDSSLDSSVVSSDSLVDSSVDSSLDSSDSSVVTPVEKAQVWSTYSTAKVIRDTNRNDDYAQGEAKIAVSLMKDEVEGTQLIVTANKKINSYSLTTADLTDGKGNTLSKDSVSVYHQKYHELTSKRKEDTVFAVGDYIPDMLLPLDIAAEYGENTIAANQNQGITVEVETTEDTVPGVYTGTFVLDLDGEKTEIPVSVEVWDIEFTGKREHQSSFLIYQNQIMTGEYNNSEETIQAYSDFLVKYKANAMIWKGDADRYYDNELHDVEDWMAEQKRLFKDDDYNSIYIPYYFTRETYRTFEDDGVTLTTNAQNCFKYLNELVKASCEADEEGALVNYVDYAYNYVIHLDEADWEGADPDGAKAKYTERLLSDEGEIRKTFNAFIAQVDSNEAYAAIKTQNPEYAESVKKALGEITTLFVNVNYMENWVGALDSTFCTYLHTFDDGATVEKYEEAAENKSNGDLWTYIANYSMNPTPSFHTDELTIGMRVAGWMQKSYNINGFLYWNTAYYRVNGNAGNYVDVYEDLDRAGYVTGDGFLLYPGRKYGSASPFASMRLVSYRDSMDDYDMLSVYERLLNAHAAEYGLSEVDFDAYVQDLYNSLFEGATYNTEDEALFAARQELANRILALQNADDTLFSAKKSGVGTKVTVYTKASTVTVDGVSKTGTACGNGYVYTLDYDTNARDVVVATANNEYTYRIAGTGNVAFDANNVTCAEGSAVEVVGDKIVASANSTFRGGQEYEGETLYFRPYVRIDCDGLEDIDSLFFTIKNTGVKGFDARVELLVGDIERVKVLNTVYCAAGEEKEVSFHVYESLEIDPTEIKAIRISFDNVHFINAFNQALGSWEMTQSLFDARTFELSNIYFDKR